jgi:hypothetical protein
MLSSEVGRGTTFMVYLPRADVAEPVVAPLPPVDWGRTGGQTVLVVEDAEGHRVPAQTIQFGEPRAENP